MAKKYHQTRKDREDESRGMKRAMNHERSRSSFVTGHDPEVGRHDFSGLPEGAVMSDYPPNRMYRGGKLDDTMSEIDAIQVDSDAVIDRHLSHQK